MKLVVFGVIGSDDELQINFAWPNVHTCIHALIYKKNLVTSFKVTHHGV